MGGAPGFARGPEDVDPQIMQAYITWNLETVRTDNQTMLRKLRTPGNPPTDINKVLPDWPVAVNLAYENDSYLNGGLGGYPLGDLNWFPDRKAQWDTERDALYAQIQSALEGGRSVSVEQTSSAPPASALLMQNYPNPFSASAKTTIEFGIANAGDVRLEVYDIVGRRVATLIDQPLTVGTYSVEWNAQDESGSRLSSGVYFYTLRAGTHTETKQMVIIR